MTREWFLLGGSAALAGVMLATMAAPRNARADDYDTPRTHQLWVCIEATSCRPEGPPKNSTACALDLAAKANTLPKGAKLTCERVTR